MSEKVSDTTLSDIANDAEPWHDYGDTVRSMARELIELRANGGWRPIETAPKDGTEFVGFGIRLGDSGYTDDEKTWTGCCFLSGRFLETKAAPRHSRGFTFTHWMPLPPVPTSQWCTNCETDQHSNAECAFEFIQNRHLPPRPVATVIDPIDADFDDMRYGFIKFEDGNSLPSGTQLYAKPVPASEKAG